jgi:hypothetical protein
MYMGLDISIAIVWETKEKKHIDKNLYGMSTVYIGYSEFRLVCDFGVVLCKTLDGLVCEKEKYKTICDDLDGTFSELSGY